MSRNVLGAELEARRESSVLTLKWNLKDIEIKTRSVELTLQPLINQVTSLTKLLSMTKVTSKMKKGRSKKAIELVAELERATGHFVRVGDDIANENEVIKNEMLAAVQVIRKTGNAMSQEAIDFTDDPTSTLKRGTIIRTARNLLVAVARLLILADMIDVYRLMSIIEDINKDFESLEHVSNQMDLETVIAAFNRNASDLMAVAGHRQRELKDPELRDELASARAVLKRYSGMMMTASKAYIRHPELAASKANRDFVLQEVIKAVNVISDVIEGKRSKQEEDVAPAGFSATLDDLDRRIIMDPLSFNEVRTRPSLEEQLERIISGASLMADSSCTRDDRRDRIVAECNAVRDALQALLAEYTSNLGKREKSSQLEKAIEHMGIKTQDLRRQLRKAVVDHISDYFMEPTTPLMIMIQEAKAGNQENVDDCAKIFGEYGTKLVEVAMLACSVSKNQEEDGIKMVRYVASQVEILCPQVINSARILGARPQSKVAQQNMENFSMAWMGQLTVLTDAVDDITTVDDFMAVSENHILEDIKTCVQAMRYSDYSVVEQKARSIRRRAERFTDVVTGEMSNYEKGMYTERVMDAVRMLIDQVMPNFDRKVKLAEESLSTDRPKEEVNDFVDASCLVYEGVREVRRCVLLNRLDEELDPEEFETSENTPTDTNVVEQFPDISEEDRKKMELQIKGFQSEKQKFDIEVAKWDDSGNDIVMIAKDICLIMMDMTDFTRRRGPLKTTMDVINAAKRISEAGSKLDKVARDIAEHCPESSTKNDLLAYLQQIDFYTHQLNITSKVKADVETMSSGILINSSLDGATSLIQAAKNLMNTVVLTVKATYVASTKYARHETDLFFPNLIWKMKPPQKKPLVRKERPEDVRAVVRRSSTKRQLAPMKILSEFHGLAEEV